MFPLCSNWEKTRAAISLRLLILTVLLSGSALGQRPHAPSRARSRPATNSIALVNAASFSGGGVSPGEIASLFGVSVPTAAIEPDTTATLPTTLGVVTVTVNDIGAPLYYVSPAQINLQIPYEVASEPTARIRAHVDGEVIADLTLSILPGHPGVFARDGSGSGQALAINQDGSWNGRGSAATSGSTVSVYATGLGCVLPLLTSGHRAPPTPLSSNTLPITAWIGGRLATIRSARVVPETAGLFRVEIVVPDGFPSESRAALQLEVSGVRSHARIHLTVSPGDQGWPKRMIHLEQGWEPKERQRYYATAQGSKMIPYDWFLALEQPDSQALLRETQHIEGLRYLSNPARSEYNPDGLPVGFVKDEDPDGTSWMGLTCAACHTGQVNYQGTAIRVDGGPALADFTALYTTMIEALDETVAGGAKWARFAGRVLGQDSTAPDESSLREQVRLQSNRLRRFAERSRSPHPYGYGRVDAFGILINEVVAEALGVPENLRVPDAPVNYPFLWDTPQLEWVQWNGSANNPLSRNLGEVSGVFSRLTLTGPEKERFNSTANVPNMFLLEQEIDKLKPPSWPQDVFGPIDSAGAERGRALFQSGRVSCSTCHAAERPYPLTLPNSHDHRFIAVSMVPFALVGTDSRAVLNFSLRTARTGELAPLLGSRQTMLAGDLLKEVLSRIMTKKFDTLRLSEPERLEYTGYRDETKQARVLSYKARPLSGIWATAPFLHNGSVPNLYELLLPAEQRSKEFYVGSREFDSQKVGFRTDAPAGSFLLRTELPGNSNAGHEYGAVLSEQQRWDLVEYLKTL